MKDCEKFTNGKTTIYRFNDCIDVFDDEFTRYVMTSRWWSDFEVRDDVRDLILKAYTLGVRDGIECIEKTDEQIIKDVIPSEWK